MGQGRSRVPVVDHGYSRRGIRAAGRDPPPVPARGLPAPFDPSPFASTSRHWSSEALFSPRHQALAVEAAAHSWPRRVIPPRGPYASLHTPRTAFVRLRGTRDLAMLRQTHREEAINRRAVVPDVGPRSLI